MLYVGLVGDPDAPPTDEVHVKNGGAGQFNVTYIVKQRGTYYLVVRYGKENIPGSPFIVEAV